MKQVNPCPRCGSGLPETGPRGLCPDCLVSGLLEDGAGGLEGGVRPAGGDGEAWFGPYRLGEELGSGSGGVVYRAWDPGLGRDVALKVLTTPPGGESGRRFRAGAEATAQLRHPHIVPVHSVGEHQGQLYLALQYVEGETLAGFLARRGALPGVEAVRLLLPVVEAVEHAHQRGILHRDLKPSNILLDVDRVPYLTDFGIAKFLNAPQDLTMTAAILGTAHYMAPEQASGRNDEVTLASDVWGLGAVLYEMLTGRPPFLGMGIPEILRQVVDEEPRPLRQLKEGLDPDLETVCLRCLRKVPAERYKTAAALAADLRAWLEGRPVAARPLGRVERMRRWAVRHPARASLLGVSVLALLGFGVAGFQWNRMREGLVRQRLLDAQRRDYNYVVDLQLAHAAWRSGTLGRMEALLDAQVPVAGEVDLRGPEWHLLRSWLDLEPARRLPPVAGVPVAIRIDPGAKVAWVLTEVGLHRVPLGAGGDVEQTPVPGIVGARDLAALPAGGWVIAATNGVWEWKGPGTGVRRLGSEPANAVALSPDGRRVLYGMRPPSEMAPPMVLRVSPLEAPETGHRLSSGGLGFRWEDSGEAVRVVMRDGGQGLWRFAEKGYSAVGAARNTTWLDVWWSETGRWFASLDSAGAIHVLDGRLEREEVVLPGHAFRGVRLAFSAGDRFCAVSGMEDGVVVYETDGWRLVHRLRAHRATVVAMAFCGEDCLVTADDQGVMRAWDLPPERRVPGLEIAHQLPYYVGQPVFSDDGAWLAVPASWTTERDHAQLIDLKGGRAPLPMPGSVAGFLGRERVLGWDRSRKVWVVMELRDGSRREYAGLPEHGEVVQAFLGGAGAVLLLGQADEGLLVVEMATGRVRRRCAGQVASWCVAADGRTLAWIERGEVVRWDMERQVERRFAWDAEEVALSGDGQWLAAAGRDRRVLLVSGQEGRPEYLVGHQAPVQSVAFSQDGRTLFSAGQDGVLMAWHLATRRELMAYRHGQRISWLLMAPRDAGLLLGHERTAEAASGGFWYWPARPATGGEGVAGESFRDVPGWLVPGG